MAYVSTDPTGPPSAHLVAMDINQLINALKNDVKEPRKLILDVTGAYTR